MTTKTQAIRILAVSAALLLWAPASAQCPQFTGNTVLVGLPETNSTPHWFQCIDGVNDTPQPFTFELTALSAAHTGVLVDWGDGTTEIVGNWDGSPLPHTYNPTAWDRYTVTVTTSFCAAGVQGLLVHELANPSASLKYGDVNGGCAPFEGLPKVDIDRGFSPTWSFSIAWGDGSGSTAYDMGQIEAGSPFNIDPFTSADGETIHRISGFSHVYQAEFCGSTGCGHDLLLTYSNYCMQYAAVDPFDGTPNGPGELEDGLSDAFLTWNKDEAAISLSTAVLCWPDSQVQVENIACANCCTSGQGNNTTSNSFVRRERWEIGAASGLESGGGGGDPSQWSDWSAACESQRVYDINFPGTGPYTLTLLTENLCGVDTAEVEVRVINPPTVDITAGSQPICPAEPFQFETVAWGYSPPATTGDFGFSFGWGDGANSSIIPMVGGMISFEQLIGQSHAYSAEGNFSPSITVFALDAPLCSATDGIAVTVLPSPTSVILLPDDSCTSSMIVQAGDASSDAITWDWSLVNPPMDLGSEAVPSPVNLTETGTYWFELTTTSGSGCSHTASQSIALNAFPIAAFSALPSCLGTATALDPSASSTELDFGGAITGYDWSLPGIGSSSDEFPQPVFNAPGLYPVSLTVTTAAGCTDSTSGEVEVLDSPVVTLLGSDTTACAPLVIELGAVDTTGTLAAGDLIWDFGHGLQSQLDPGGTHTFPHNLTENTIQYQVSVAAGLGGCGNSESITVSVLPAPAIWLNGGSACSGEIFNFEAEAFGVAPGTQWSWVVNNVYNVALETYGSAESQFPSWAYAFNNPGETTDTLAFTLELATPGGCVAMESGTLLLHPPLSVDLSSALSLDGNQCTPYTLEAAALPVLNADWDFGDLANPDPPGAIAHTYFSPDTFTVVFEGQSVFGCWGTDSVEVAIHPLPAVELSSANPVCAPETSNLIRSELGGGGIGNSAVMDWQLALDLGAYTPWDASSDTSLMLGAGLHLATLSATNGYGCTVEVSADLLVHPSVEAGFTMPEGGCAPVNIDIEALASGSGNAISTWVLTSQLGSDTTTGPAPGGPAWWTSGGQDSSIWSVHRTVSDDVTGCSAFFADSLTVVDQPIGGLSVSGLSGCEVNAELAYSGSAESYIWTTGDPFEPGTVETPGASLQHVYGNALGTGYWATATISASTGSCTDVDELTFEVPAWVAAEMGLPATICSGDALDLENLSVGIEGAAGTVAGTWTWTVEGIEVVAFEPLGVVLDAAGSANEVADILLIAIHPETGCSDTASGQVVILGTPAPSFLINPDVLVAPNYNADLVGLSSAADGTSSNWSATGGGEVAGGIGIESGSVNWGPDIWGEQSVTLILNNNGCTAQVTQTVLLIPLPPTIEISGDTIGCAPLQGNFQAAVQGVVDSVIWNFGDGTTRVVFGAFGLDVLQGYFTPGEFVVTATAYGPGGYGVSENTWVDVMLQVNAGFTVFPTACLEAGETSDFTPYINYPEATYRWDFGDGFSEVTNGGVPVNHSFSMPGSPTVQLVVEQGACSDSTWVTLCVEDIIGGSIEMPTGFTPLEGGGGGGGGDISAYDVRDNDIFAPIIRGVVLAYNFTVYNRWGEMIFQTSDPEIGWTGHYNGKLCKQDVYVWKVSAVFQDGSSAEYASDVTLIRR